MPTPGPHPSVVSPVLVARIEINGEMSLIWLPLSLHKYSVTDNFENNTLVTNNKYLSLLLLAKATANAEMSLILLPLSLQGKSL